MLKKVSVILITLLILPVVAGCSSPEETYTPVTPDYWPTEDWRTSTPEEQGMDPEMLNEGIKYINNEGLEVHSFIVIRHGYIFIEEYWGRYEKNTRHVLQSVTKSYISALIGIAMKEGYIESLDKKMVDFFPGRTIQNLDSRKETITLEDMLMMTDGLEWPEWGIPYDDERNIARQMAYEEDPVQFVLDRPMANEPGAVLNYNSGISHLLSAIISQTTGEGTLNFAKEYLFEPIGITSVILWMSDSQGLRFGGWGLSLAPRDMAKLGLLYLQNGAWDGNQIIPTDYITASVESYYYWEPEAGYGYHWWTAPELGCYFALGVGGQFVGVFPELDMVVVVTANIDEVIMMERYYTIVEQYILESIIDK